MATPGAGSTAERYAARSRWALRRALELDELGLSEWFALGMRRRYFWSEVRGVRWLSDGEAQVVTTRGEIRLDRRSGDVRELVAAIEDRADASQRAWDDRGIPGAAIAAWLSLPLPYRYDTLPPPERIRNVAIGLAASLYALGLVVFSAPFALIGGMVLAAGIAHLCMPGIYVCAEERGLELQTLAGRVGLDWRSVRQYSHEDDSHGNTAVRVFADERWHDLVLPTSFAAPLVRLLEKVVEANHATFTDAGDQPISDAALSQVRLTADPSVERGLSRLDATAAQDDSASSA